MSISSGFFNSFNGDRKYDAAQMASIFDGLIVDGVFASIGTAFSVKAAGGMVVNVGVGKAWFNHTWTLNDSVLALTAPETEILLDRIDAVVIEVNTTDEVRENTIKFVKGTPSETPLRPLLKHEDRVHQYPLCYIFRKHDSSEILQSDITSTVGTDATPFITGILKTISLDELLGQWQDELDRFVDAQSEAVAAWIASEKADLMREQALLDEWISTEQTDFLSWYNRMKDQLEEDSAGKLQLAVDKEEVKRILLTGFVDGTKEISSDGTKIISVSGDGRRLEKYIDMNPTPRTLAVLYSSDGAKVAELYKTFTDGGMKISVNVTYY